MGAHCYEYGHDQTIIGVVPRVGLSVVERSVNLRPSADNITSRLIRYHIAFWRLRAFSQRTGVAIEVGCLALTYSLAIASSKAQAI
jgi:hypothetical protein